MGRLRRYVLRVWFSLVFFLFFYFGFVLVLVLVSFVIVCFSGCAFFCVLCFWSLSRLSLSIQNKSLAD